MQRLVIKTRKKREVVDITDRLGEFVGKNASGRNGVCNVLVLHTTAALTTADLDPGTDLDMLDAFEAMIPKIALPPSPRPATCARSHSLGADWDLGGVAV